VTSERLSRKERGQLRDLRRRCEATIADLAIPEPFDLDTLCAHMAKRRGRPVRLASMPHTSSMAAPCGMWVALAEEDIILIEAQTSALHHDQIGLHEIAHIICDHDNADSMRADSLGSLMPNLDPGMVRRVLGRASDDHPQEREAEMVATLLGERIRTRSAPAADRPLRPEEDNEVLRKLARALGGKAADV
jgi:hypothetical protein